jgi:hypothetical protein
MLSRLGTYLCDPEIEIGIAAAPGNAAELLLELRSGEAGEVALEADQGALSGDCSVAGDALGVPLIDPIPERPLLLLLAFRSAIWS